MKAFHKDRKAVGAPKSTWCLVMLLKESQDSDYVISLPLASFVHLIRNRWLQNAGRVPRHRVHWRGVLLVGFLKSESHSVSQCWFDFSDISDTVVCVWGNLAGFICMESDRTFPMVWPRENEKDTLHDALVRPRTLWWEIPGFDSQVLGYEINVVNHNQHSCYYMSIGMAGWVSAYVDG